ncbi:MAG: Alanine racemase [Acidimicrobiales bacterium]|nr:Alanine racemase [Acidimicrobiales bacterium]
MTTPRLEVRLDRIEHNATTLVERLGARGITVTGVTKATLGSAAVAAALVRSGVAGLGESRIENVEALRRGGVVAPITLIRAPMPSQVDRVVRHADVSLNTELATLERLSSAAAGQDTVHGVILMVELGDLREGILPADLASIAHCVRELPHLELRGIGTNLACQSGVAPDARNMAELSALAATIEAATGAPVAIVSGGNSANLGWALSGAPVGRVNDLRLGEAVLLGCDPLDRRPIPGLRTDAFRLVAEVIEAKAKPSLPWGALHQSAFGPTVAATDEGTMSRVIVALGRQDVDPDGLTPPPGYRILGASSDHLVLDGGSHVTQVGAELSFTVDYAALLRAMTSPFVTILELDAP